MLGAQVAQAGQTSAQTQAGQASVGQTQAALVQQAIPDAPNPHASLPNLESVTPGQGAVPTTVIDTTGSAPATVTAAPQPAASAAQVGVGQAMTAAPPPEEDVKAEATLHVQVNYVEVPFSEMT